MSDKRQVKLGPREYVGATKLGDGYSKGGGAALGARIGVTIGAALTNARKLGINLQFIGSDGRKYAYDLETSKVAHELDKRGIRTGKTIGLIDIEPPRLTPKPKANLSVVK